MVEVDMFSGGGGGEKFPVRVEKFSVEAEKF